MSETTETKPKGADAWKKSRVHENVTLPSGFQVDITIPNLATLITSGELPNPLVDAALQNLKPQQEDGSINREALEKSWDFIKFIVPRMLVSPTVTPDDVDDLPIEDVEMLAGFATRSNDIDAVGHHLGGLETHRSFRELRGLLTLDEALSSD
jgi:hypothetical protein